MAFGNGFRSEEEVFYRHLRGLLGNAAARKDIKRYKRYRYVSPLRPAEGVAVGGGSDGLITSLPVAAPIGRNVEIYQSSGLAIREKDAAPGSFAVRSELSGNGATLRYGERPVRVHPVLKADRFDITNDNIWVKICTGSISVCGAHSSLKRRSKICLIALIAACASGPSTFTLSFVPCPAPSMIKFVTLRALTACSPLPSVT